MKRKLIASVILNCILILILIITLNHYWMLGKNIDNAVDSEVSKTENVESLYYLIKKELFENTVDSTDEIIFLGDSITDINEWGNDFPEKKIINMGINGDTTLGVLKRIDNVIRLEPKKVFIMIGINDIIMGIDNEKIVENYIDIVSSIKSGSPNTEIYIQSILPINKNMVVQNYKIKNDNDVIININDQLKKISEDQNIFYLDLYPNFLSSASELDDSFSIDGLHLNKNGYEVWNKEIKKLINY